MPSSIHFETVEFIRAWHETLNVPVGTPFKVRLNREDYRTFDFEQFVACYVNTLYPDQEEGDPAPFLPKVKIDPAVQYGVLFIDCDFFDEGKAILRDEGKGRRPVIL